SPRPRARYKSWIDDGCTPTACPISQISHRASSRSSGSPNTAVLTSLSIAGDAMADSSWTITLPSRTVTALLNGFANMLVEKLSGKPEEGSLPQTVQRESPLGSDSHSFFAASAPGRPSCAYANCFPSSTP